MAYVGHGSQMKEMERGAFGRGGAPFSFGFYEQVGERKAMLPILYLPKNTKNRRIVILDDIKSEEDVQFVARLIMGFKYNGRFGNAVVSLNGVDERGCPFGDALQRKNDKTGAMEPQRGSRVWLLTAIEETTFTYKQGARKGQTVVNPRRAVPVPLGEFPQSKVSRAAEFMNFAVRQGGLRGCVFEVSRGAGDTSSRIGDPGMWYPVGKLSEAELRSKYGQCAQSNGYGVDQYLAPADYFSVFKPMPFDDAVKAAKAIRASNGATQPADEVPADEDTNVVDEEESSVPF